VDFVSSAVLGERKQSSFAHHAGFDDELRSVRARVNVAWTVGSSSLSCGQSGGIVFVRCSVRSPMVWWIGFRSGVMVGSKRPLEVMSFGRFSGGRVPPVEKAGRAAQGAPERLCPPFRVSGKRRLTGGAGRPCARRRG
jgi:hypothetical protein